MTGLRRIPNSSLIDGAKLDNFPIFLNIGTKYLRDDGTRQTVAGSGDMLASVYDPTNKYADAFSMDNMVETATKKILTATERTNLGNQSGTNTGDQDLSALALKSNVLELNNTTPFTPDADYEPATKKYVDDNSGGGGDVSGPASAVDSNFAAFDTTTGKLIKDSGHKHSDYALALGADDNYVTNAEKTVIGNTSGTNTGDEVAGQAIGFTITKGTTPKTLTVPLDASVSGTNTGDNAANTSSVANSLFDANTILKADTDNTPEALIVTEQTIVGRKTGGEITALTPTEVRTMINVADGATANTKATGAEVDTGTDDAKFVTSKAMEDSAYIKAAGIPYASIAETNTGTETAKSVTPDALSGSYAGTKGFTVIAVDAATSLTVADGKAYIAIPECMNGMLLVRANAIVNTAGTTNATTIDIYNVTDSHDMLSTAISIASAGTVGTAGTVDASYDDVATNDVLRIDVTSMSTTAPKGLIVVLEFRLP